MLKQLKYFLFIACSKKNKVKVYNVFIVYRLLSDKKSAQKVWSKDLVYKGTFLLSSRTQHAYKVSYELLHI